MFFDMDITQAFSGNRLQLSEVAVYRVADGKIIEETFMLNPGQMAA